MKVAAEQTTAACGCLSHIAVSMFTMPESLTLLHTGDLGIGNRPVPIVNAHVACVHLPGFQAADMLTHATVAEAVACAAPTLLRPAASACLATVPCKTPGI